MKGLSQLTYTFYIALLHFNFSPSISCLFLFPPTQLYRYQCGVPVIIEGETGVGKTALVEMLSKLWNHSLLLEWKRQRSQLLDSMKRKMGNISIEISEKYQVCDDFCRTMYVVCFTRISETVHIIPFFFHFLTPFVFSSIFQVCAHTMERLIAGQYVTKEELLGQLPDPPDDYRKFYSLLRSILLSMKSNPVVTLLTLQESQQQEASLEELFERAENEDSAEVRSFFTDI